MTVSVSKNWVACLNAICDALKDQNLDGIGADVHVQDKPFVPGKQVRPGCYVTPTDRKPRPYSTGRNMIGYGCQITVVIGYIERFGGNPEQRTGWQEEAARLFHDKRPTSLEIREGDCVVPWSIEDAPAEWSKAKEEEKIQVVGSAIVVRAWVIERRT